MSVSEANPKEQTVYYGYVELETPMGALSQGSGNARVNTDTIKTVPNNNISGGERQTPTQGSVA